MKVVTCLENLHGGDALQQLRHHANVVWIEVLNYDKSHPVIFGHVLKKQFQCFKSACRGADANDGELTTLCFSGYFCFVFLCR